MVLETELVRFLDWIRIAPIALAAIIGALFVLFLIIGYLIVAVRHGPIAGGDITFRVVKSMFLELLQISPRRVWALARLAVQESIRRRVLAAFAVFLVILLFAAWFLDPTTNNPGTLYLSFVLNATLYLMLPMALFLSAFSLPADLKSKTIYTVVTKPVRACEIVLGRTIGFAIIGTGLLAVIGLFSYGFVTRVLNHTHEVLASDSAAPTSGKPLLTTTVHNHHHQITLYEDGTGTTDMQQGHTHDVTAVKKGDKTTYVVGPAEGMLAARVPVYGTLKFLDRNGDAKERGISVGNEWTYRSFIEGRTHAAGIFRFSGVTKAAFPDGLPLAMTVRVFRTYKGDIEAPIHGTLQLRNPQTDRHSALIFFSAKDASIDLKDIPNELTDPSGKQQLDLFRDLVTPEGEIEVRLACVEPAQYFGLARGDMWLRAGDASFGLNFIKGYFGIWLQMLLVIGLGVMYSTFLNGAVAMMATVSTVVLGFYSGFVSELAAGKIKGGGPLESMVRIFNQQNMIIEMEEGLTKTVVTNIDWALLHVMELLGSVLPNFRHFSNANYVAYGFDISLDMVLIQASKALAFLLGAFLIGYFFLKTREVAR